ncbi:MAG: hypothetical protein QM578_00055 [Pantoea sp.]|uniref:hypothetical protein n=1 Tax=Pantoea sp. TaxID=69393 RepID=UPI0039E2D5A9
MMIKLLSALFLWAALPASVVNEGAAWERVPMQLFQGVKGSAPAAKGLRKIISHCERLFSVTSSCATGEDPGYIALRDI